MAIVKSRKNHLALEIKNSGLLTNERIQGIIGAHIYDPSVTNGKCLSPTPRGINRINIGTFDHKVGRLGHDLQGEE